LNNSGIHIEQQYKQPSTASININNGANCNPAENYCGGTGSTQKPQSANITAGSQGFNVNNGVVTTTRKLHCPFEKEDLKTFESFYAGGDFGGMYSSKFNAAAGGMVGGGPSSVVHQSNGLSSVG
jgi:hypothetical protein